MPDPSLRPFVPQPLTDPYDELLNQALMQSLNEDANHRSTQIQEEEEMLKEVMRMSSV